MKALLIVGAILVIGGGVWIASNLASAPEEVPQTETVTASSGSPVASITLRGTFNEQDAIHKGAGGVVVDNGQVRFGDDFSVTEGPDVYVYLSKAADGKDLDNAVSLGKIKSSKGAQTYVAPANYADYQSVVIYCRAFSVTFSVAGLSR